MSSTPQDPYGSGDQPDRSTGAPPPYGSTPPPPPAGDTPPPYGSTPPPYAGGTGGGPSFGGGPAYGSTPPSYGGADYGAGYVGGQPGYGYPRNNLGVWSLVLGLVGIFICGLFTGIPAIVVGHKARRAVADGEANNPGMATAGIVLGWIATILSLLGVLAVIALVATGSFTELQNADPSF